MEATKDRHQCGICGVTDFPGGKGFEQFFAFLRHFVELEGFDLNAIAYSTVHKDIMGEGIHAIRAPDGLIWLQFGPGLSSDAWFKGRAYMPRLGDPVSLEPQEEPVKVECVAQGCGLAFMDSDELEAHMAAEHPAPPFECKEHKGLPAWACIPMADGKGINHQASPFTGRWPTRRTMPGSGEAEPVAKHPEPTRTRETEDAALAIVTDEADPGPVPDRYNPDPEAVRPEPGAWHDRAGELLAQGLSARAVSAQLAAEGIKISHMAIQRYRSKDKVPA